MNDQHNRDNPAPHQIRLQSVWDPPLPGSSDAWRRQFGRPAGIASGVRVLLAVDSPAMASLVLNGVALTQAAGPRWRHDVTHLLADRNELAVVPAVAAHASEPANARGRVSLPLEFGRVSLEILTPPQADQ
jgi:hypothetical protein